MGVDTTSHCLNTVSKPGSWSGRFLNRLREILNVTPIVGSNERTSVLVAVAMTWTWPAATNARVPSGVIAISPLLPTATVAVTV